MACGDSRSSFYRVFKEGLASQSKDLVKEQSIAREWHRWRVRSWPRRLRPKESSCGALLPHSEDKESRWQRATLEACKSTRLISFYPPSTQRNATCGACSSALRLPSPTTLRT